MTNEVSLTHRSRFSASHFYYLDEWTEEQNHKIFGKSANRNGHGHDYLVEVTMRGPVDPKTGMVMNIQDLKSIVSQALEALAHKNLNLEIPYFQTHLPTPENISIYLWESISSRLPVGNLESIRVSQGNSLAVENRGTLCLSRNYEFSAAHRLLARDRTELENKSIYGKCSNPEGHGHNYSLEVTVSGNLDPKTGTIADVEKLDKLLQAEVLHPWDHRNLDKEIEEFADRVSTGENMAQIIWKKLDGKLDDAKLVSVKIGETPNAFFEAKEGKVI